MRASSKIFAGLAVLVAIIVVGVIVGLLGGRGSAPGLPASNQVTSATPPADHTSPLQNTNPPPPRPIRPLQPTVVPPAVTGSNPPPLDANAITNWESKLDEILAADGDDADKAKQLMEMFPHLPPDGQTEVAQHLANLLPDSDYPQLGQLLENPKLPEDVLDVLLGDLLNRPNSVKLPLLLDVARNPDHPKAAEAKDLLELYIGADYGTDWATWQQKMQDWMKENPD